MLGLKRARDNMEDSDDEPAMGKQNLPVARLPDNFNGEPVDGMQYLFTVRRDARKLPNYTRVENPFATAIVPKVEKADAPIVTRARVALPSEEWRAVFLSRFKNFRKNSTQATIGAALPVSTGRSKVMPEMKQRDNWWAFINGRPEYEWNPPKNPKKPRQERNKYTRTARESDSSMHDLSQYEVSYADEDHVPARGAFVVNEYGEITEGSTGLDMEQEEEEIIAADSLPTPFSTPRPESRRRSPGPNSERQNVQVQSNRSDGPRQPTPALLKLMDSRYCAHILMYFTYWITQNLAQLESPQPLPSSYARLSQVHACWMFALLSRVDAQLTSDELSNLRSLARACLAFIKDLNKNYTSNGGPDSGVLGNWVGDAAEAPMDERACWIIVAIITEFWGQKDLWMDAESMLSGA